jgi:DNA (cytosine-5)-methyltransferase 1
MRATKEWNNDYDNLDSNTGLTHGGLFSGIGGFELGAKLAGIKTIWSCEIEEDRRKILQKHFPNTEQYDNILTITNPAYVDVISGGFPCQDISIANVSNKKIWNDGTLGIKGERSGLWSEMWRICRDVRPKYIIFENSPMLLIRGFERVLCDLSEGGYVCEWQCLSASQFGYNHKRERLYGIAHSGTIRCKNNIKIFRELSKILQPQPPRQNTLSMPLKRFNGNTIHESIRMDDGFPDELDKKRIEDCGNAVIPEIANYLFQCIKLFEYENTQQSPHRFAK